MTGTIRHPGAWALAMCAITLAAFAGAARLLHEARMGTDLGVRACTSSPLPGLMLLVVAGIGLGWMWALVERAGRDAAFHVRLSRSPMLLIVPIVCCGATLPGTLGCAFSRRLADLPLISDAFVGMSGAQLCAASMVMLGSAISHVVRVDAAHAQRAPLNRELVDDDDVVTRALAHDDIVRARANSYQNVDER